MQPITFYKHYIIYCNKKEQAFRVIQLAIFNITLNLSIISLLTGAFLMGFINSIYFTGTIIFSFIMLSRFSFYRINSKWKNTTSAIKSIERVEADEYPKQIEKTLSLEQEFSMVELKAKIHKCTDINILRNSLVEQIYQNIAVRNAYQTYLAENYGDDSEYTIDVNEENNV